MNRNLKKFLEKIPNSPGVYQFMDKEGEVLYVGKAKNLKKRVKSYFQNQKQQSPRTKKLVSQIHDIDYTVTSSELEAVILETNLIKQIRPKYNILMKDDKNFVYIKITVNEDFPQIMIVRKVKNDGALYFGPKTAAGKVKKTLDVLKKLFPYRHCNLFIKYKKKGVVKVKNKAKKYPCLDYHINRCIGPCIGNCTKEEYNDIINKITNFLKGRTGEIIESLKKEMQKAAEEKKFEKAAKLRDKLKAVEEISEKQLVSTPKRKDMDIINYVKQLGRAFITLFMVRDGKLINQENFVFKSGESNEEIENPEEIIESFLQQYYEKTTDLPKEILIPHKIHDQDIIEEWISIIKNGRVNITVPQKGEKHKILNLAHKNAKSFANRSRAKWQIDEEKRKRALNELKKYLNLKKTPKRIECYDISHISGTHQVASMVVFENGAPVNKKYRRFKIRTVADGKPDDFAAMLEVLNRRLLYLVKSKSDVKIKKASKKDTDSKNIYKGVLDDKVIAVCRYEKPDGIDVFKDIKFNTKNEEKKTDFITAITEKAKYNRVYACINKDLTEIFEKSGFRQLRKKPKDIKQKKGEICLLFDKSKYKKEKGFSEKPDLIVIDGGKGQLSQGIKIEKKYKVDIPLAALAKRNEDVYIPGKPGPAPLPKNSDGQYLLQQVRDEAHRFALSYHHKLRSKALTKR